MAAEDLSLKQILLNIVLYLELDPLVTGFGIFIFL